MTSPSPDPDCFALALHQQGALLLRLGRTAEGLARLDEARVGVCAEEASPMVTGIVYCGVVQDCWSVYEVGRAQQWTAAMSVWCDSQPELANFTGECNVRRAELKQFHGRLRRRSMSSPVCRAPTLPTTSSP